MYRRRELQEHLRNLGVQPDDILLVHSSMKAIGEVEGGADTVLDVLMDYLGNDGLLVLPTHTWDKINQPGYVYDPDATESCVGILTELFRKRLGVYRSLHPSHSVAAFGKNAEEFVSGEENSHSPCARSGCWGKLYDRKAKVLFLGCPLTKNTFLHGVEEWNEVPDRLTEEEVPFSVRLPDGAVKTVWVRKHHNSSYPDISKFYGKMKPAFLAKGIAKEGRFGDAECVLADAVGMADLTSEYLKKNPDLFLGDAPVPEEWYLDAVSR